MALIYVRFDVAMHGLNLSSNDEIELLRRRVKELLEEYHPSG